MALLARFACGCVLRVEIPAPPFVACTEHGVRARLIALPSGQVRYEAKEWAPPESSKPLDHP